MNDGMYYTITDDYGHLLCEPMLIPWEDIYWIKRTFLCTVQYGQIILH